MKSEVLRSGLSTGAALSAATAASMMVAAAVERGSPWAGFNAMATAVGARRVPDDFDPGVTPVGAAVLVGGLVAWGVAYQGALALLGRPSTLWTGAASGLGGFLLDRLLLPDRLVPSFARAMGAGGNFAKYAALALASAASPAAGARR